MSSNLRHGPKCPDVTPRACDSLTKRVIDIVGSLFLILATAPVLILACIAVAVTSPGAVIFVQNRWGLNERWFRCYKLRSMYAVPVQSNAIDAPDTQTCILEKRQDDPRVTPVGAFLRRTSIDELPQLFNVLKGDMSLVGPRPLVIKMMNAFPEVRSWRCAVRPGITGLWQLRHRHNNTTVFHMIDDDLEYIQTFSISLDIKILVATVPAIFRAAGAY